MKTKNYRKLVVLSLILTMAAMYGFLPRPDNANAVDSITDAKDTMSDTDLDVASSTHAFSFTTGTTTPAGGYWQIDFNTDWFTGINSAAVNCGSDAYQATLLTASSTGPGTIVQCMANGDVEATSTVVTVYGVGNPSTSTNYRLDIKLIGQQSWKNSTSTIEQVQVQVFMIEDVLMTATVDSSLNFTVTGTTTNAVVNGVACGNASTATTAPFNVLVVDVPSTVCQDLNVETNADDGFTVTVWQDNEMTSDSGSNINSFNNSPDNTGTTTAEIWDTPDNILDVDYTYGHMGLTSNDYNLASSTGYNNFANYGGAALYAGLNATDPMPIMHHTGPTDGLAQNIGYATVLYQVEVASLQEAGDYENTLTYVCTPTF